MRIAKPIENVYYNTFSIASPKRRGVKYLYYRSEGKDIPYIPITGRCQHILPAFSVNFEKMDQYIDALGKDRWDAGWEDADQEQRDMLKAASKNILDDLSLFLNNTFNHNPKGVSLAYSRSYRGSRSKGFTLHAYYSVVTGTGDVIKLSINYFLRVLKKRVNIISVSNTCESSNMPMFLMSLPFGGISRVLQPDGTTRDTNNTFRSFNGNMPGFFRRLASLISALSSTDIGLMSAVKNICSGSVSQMSFDMLANIAKELGQNAEDIGISCSALTMAIGDNATVTFGDVEVPFVDDTEDAVDETDDSNDEE